MDEVRRFIEWLQANGYSITENYGDGSAWSFDLDALADRYEAERVAR